MAPQSANLFRLPVMDTQVCSPIRPHTARKRGALSRSLIQEQNDRPFVGGRQERSRSCNRCLMGSLFRALYIFRQLYTSVVSPVAGGLSPLSFLLRSATAGLELVLPCGHPVHVSRYVPVHAVHPVRDQLLFSLFSCHYL